MSSGWKRTWPRHSMEPWCGMLTAVTHVQAGWDWKYQLPFINRENETNKKKIEASSSMSAFSLENEVQAFKTDAAWERKRIQRMLVFATKASVLAKLTPDIHEVIHLHTTACLQYKRHQEIRAKTGWERILEKQKEGAGRGIWGHLHQQYVRYSH